MKNQPTSSPNDENVFGQQLELLVNYLMLSPHEFAHECNLATGTLVSGYFEGRYKPTLDSIIKIRNRYPINYDWLLHDEDEMWNVDYFQDRFERMKDTECKTFNEKILLLKDIFEANYRTLSIRMGIDIQKLKRVAQNPSSAVAYDCINTFSENISYIPREWYLEYHNKKTKV